MVLAMREYGGYLEFEHKEFASYYPNMLALNTGRNCLKYLIQAKNIKHIYMPRFICEVVIQACEDESVQIDYYSIDKNFMPKDLTVDDEEAYVYIVNYYGILKDEVLIQLSEKWRIIIDNAQAFFRKPIHGIDTIYTCRNFFGVSDGAYLSTDVIMDKELSTDHSDDRMEYLFGRIDTCASDFYNKFQENEEELGNKETAYMSNVTKAILSLVDYESVKEKRTENFQELNRELNQYNKIKNLNHITGAYMYPLLIKDGANVRKYLQEHKIYISMLWPNVIETEAEDSYEYYLVQNILPIPCDQRYDSDDMRYIATMIKKIVEVQE